MERYIYIKLLNEGTKVYKPVPARLIIDNIYEVRGLDIYDPEDETWGFIPSTYVLVEEQELSGENVWVAIKEESQV